MIPPLSLVGHSTSIIQKLTAPPAAPHVSGLVIQASVWIPRSIHWLLVWSVLTALFTWNMRLFRTDSEQCLQTWKGNKWTTIDQAWLQFFYSSEPPPMPVDTSVGMWIKKAWLPCWSLYSQQVSQQRWIWGIAHRQESVQVRNPYWLWNSGQTSPEVQNRGISGLTKRTYVLQKFYMKEILL